ncbi:hypothetical protein V3C99_000238 [Haemonchus contortus]
MFIRSIAVLFLALQNSSGLFIRVRDANVTCKNGGHKFLGYSLRKSFLEAHNVKRASLAQGNEDFPKAADMRFMAYDCGLEKEAIQLTKKCQNFTDRTQFNGTRTNFAIIENRSDNGPNKVAQQAVSDWWNTKPQAWEEAPKITEKDNLAMPFFLTAQADMDKVGCSVDSCKGDNGESYYTIACRYGKDVNVGGELYKQGEACSTCSEHCYKGVLCKN